MVHGIFLDLVPSAEAAVSLATPEHSLSLSVSVTDWACRLAES